MRFLEHFMTAPIASGWSKIAGWVSHPLENAAFARRTPNYDFRRKLFFVMLYLTCYLQ